MTDDLKADVQALREILRELSWNPSIQIVGQADRIARLLEHVERLEAERDERLREMEGVRKLGLSWASEAGRIARERDALRKDAERMETVASHIEWSDYGSQWGFSIDLDSLLPTSEKQPRHVTADELRAAIDALAQQAKESE